MAWQYQKVEAEFSSMIMNWLNILQNQMLCFDDFDKSAATVDYDDGWTLGWHNKVWMIA